MQKALDFNLRNDARFEVLEPAVIRTTDDWDIKEEWFESALADDHIVDFYLVNTAFGANTVIEEFALRTKKPMYLILSRCTVRWFLRPACDAAPTSSSR